MCNLAKKKSTFLQDIALNTLKFEEIGVHLWHRDAGIPASRNENLPCDRDCRVSP